MDINQLSEIIKKKILKYKIINSINIEDKSYLHKNHQSNQLGKFHLKLTIKSDELSKKNSIESNKFIYKVLNDEMKSYIHSIQILFI